jgi:hypothetical protein
MRSSSVTISLRRKDYPSGPATTDTALRST